jgi:hypothetical protein
MLSTIHRSNTTRAAEQPQPQQHHQQQYHQQQQQHQQNPPQSHDHIPMSSMESQRTAVADMEKKTRENLVKRQLMMRLQRIRMSGTEVTPFTLEDSAEDMQFEIEKHYSNGALVQDIRNVTNMAKSGGVAIHFLNKRLLKTKIDTREFPKTWAKMVDDCSPAIEELYHRHKGKKGVRGFKPEMTILLAVLGILWSTFSLAGSLRPWANS